MPIPLTCPKCSANFQGDEIPEKYLDLYGGETRYSRVIGIHSWELDAVVAWACPDCGHRWQLTDELPFGLRTFQMAAVAPPPE